YIPYKLVQTILKLEYIKITTNTESKIRKHKSHSHLTHQLTIMAVTP
ncbi:hypothetical protein X975_03825, partial [Stegodyphus mimosarum]